MAPDNLDEKLAEATRVLMQIPGVLSVAYGYKEREGKSTQELSFVVLVRKKKAPSALSPTEVVPHELFGIPTDVIRAPRLRKLACETIDKFDTLVGGIMISDLKVYVASDSLSGERVGTLGFFGTLNTSGSRDNVVLLSNHHVLVHPPAAVNDVIYQPKFTGGGGAYNLERNDMHPIGYLENLGLEGNRDYAYTGEAASSMFVDCATAHVNTSFSSCCGTNCGIKFANVLHNLSLAPGLTSSAAEGIARVTNADLPSGGDYVVYKVGHRTGWTKGKIRTAVVNLVDPDDASIRHNKVMIIDDLGPNCGGGAHFAEEGDSGAVILNAQRQIIGLLFADADTGFYVACHIHPVVDLLRITMVSTQHTAGASGGATSLEMSLSLDESAEDMARAMALQEQIVNSERGRRYRALVEKHLDEVDHLVNRVRPVTVAWHRLHGPDFLGHILHASRHADYAVPRELDGLRREDALAQLLETFSHYGSAELRADIACHVDEVRALFNQIDDIGGLAAQLPMLERTAQ